ncbi:baseplate J/gp47 family protein [Streptomyces sp. NPDC092307]|uniref:baseplate J/gp47 family protein n=1 Tax=Streptomyces sp. NPDC092307 TaxID=3366013 RepID=UPI0038156022
MSEEVPPFIVRDRSQLVEDAVKAVRTEPGGSSWLGGPDAGRALLEVCAVMSDRMHAMLNLVPEKTRLEVLIRAGAEPHPPSPARGRLDFTTTSDSVRIPLGTEVATSSEFQEEPVVFSVTAQRTIGGGAGLLAAGLFTQVLVADVDAAGVLLPFSAACPPASGVRACRSGTSDADPSGRRAEWPLAGGTGSLLFVYDRPPVPDVVTLAFKIPEGAHPRLRYTWECFAEAADCGVREWLPCQVLNDSTAGFSREGTVTLRLPAARVPARARIAVTSGAASTPAQRAAARLPASAGLVRCVPVRPFDQRVPAVTDVTGEALVDAIQGQLSEPQDLGVSSGLPNQRFALDAEPLTADWPLTVEVAYGEKTEVWTHRATLADSLPTDHHFTIDRTTNDIVFGVLSRSPHGMRQFGAIPEKDTRLTLSRHLTDSGGAQGNVPPGTVTVLRTDLANVTGVTNSAAFTGGADGEDASTAAERAPLGEALPDRAMTAADYARLAPTLGAGIARAIVEPWTGPEDNLTGRLSDIWPARGASSAVPARATAHLTLVPGTGDGREADLPAGAVLEIPAPSASTAETAPVIPDCEPPLPPPAPPRFRTLRSVPLVRHLGLSLGIGGALGPWRNPDTSTVEITGTSAEFTTALPAGVPLEDCALTLLLSAADPADSAALLAARPTMVLTAYCTPRADTGDRPARTLRTVTTGPVPGRVAPRSGGGGTSEAVAFTSVLGERPEWRQVLRQPLATSLAEALGNAAALEDEGFPTTAAMWLRVRVDGIPFATAVQGLQLQVTSVDVAVEQSGVVEAGTLLGTMSEDPDQVIALLPPAAGQNPAITVTVDGVPQTWTTVPSFASSNTDSRHVVVDPSGRVHFGPLIGHRDGVVRRYGARPSVGAQIAVAESYCTTMGSLGNLADASILLVHADLTGFPDMEASLGPADGGVDAVPPADRTAGHPERYHPVTLLVVPYLPNPEGYLDCDDLLPSATVHQALEDALSTITPVGAELFIEPPGYVTVGFEATVSLDHDADEAATLEAVSAALYRYFNPLTGGPDGAGWPFGRKVHEGDAYRQIEAVHGVAEVTTLKMYEVNTTDWGNPVSNGTIDVTTLQLVRSARHQICAEEDPCERLIPLRFPNSDVACPTP